MPQRDVHPRAGEPAHQVEGSLALGRYGHDSQPVEHRLQHGAIHSRGKLDERLVLGALLLRRDARPLDVEAERLRAILRRARHPATHAVGEGCELLERRGHRRGHERGHPVAQECARHPVQSRLVAHRVVATPAMDVDVHESWAEVRPGVAGVVLLD